MKRQQTNRLIDRRGYTLLEVLLALGLTVVIFSLIAGGIRLYLVAITNQQIKIEQRQIARSLLNTIGNDIRAAVLYRATDYSGLENIRATALKQGSSSALNADSDPENVLAAIEAAADTEADTEAASDNATDSDEEIEELIQEENVSYRPVLKGTNRSISFDISRLPRLDQYRSFGSSGGQSVDATPSDIKSISYFFSASAASNEPLGQSASSIATGGLYRREVDRAVAAFAELDGLSTSPDSVSRLLAPEVASIRFRYFDGFDWWTEWDFDERGGLPMAVELQLTVDPSRTVARIANDPSQDQRVYYRSVVHLPLAEVREDEDE